MAVYICSTVCMQCRSMCVCQSGGEGVVFVVQCVCNAGQCVSVSQEVKGCVGQALKDSSCALLDVSYSPLNRMDVHTWTAGDPCRVKGTCESSPESHLILAPQGSAAVQGCTYRWSNEPYDTSKREREDSFRVSYVHIHAYG